MAQRSARVGLTLLLFLVVVAIFADVIAPYQPNEVLRGPGAPGRRAEPCIHLFYEVPIVGAWGCPADQAETWLGTDGNSRDIFSRVVYGARISLPIGPIVVGIAILIGALLGAIAGFASGWSDNILMRIMDIVLAFPALILAIAIVTLIGNGLYNAVAAVVIISIPPLRAAHAIRRALDAREGLRDGLARAGRVEHRHPAPARHPQLDHAADRGRLTGHRHGRPGGRGALLPGPRHLRTDG